MINKKYQEYFFFIFKNRYNTINPNIVRIIPMTLEYGIFKNVYLSFKKRRDNPAISKINQSTNLIVTVITNLKGGILTKTNGYCFIYFWSCNYCAKQRVAR